MKNQQFVFFIKTRACTFLAHDPKQLSYKDPIYPKAEPDAGGVEVSQGRVPPLPLSAAFLTSLDVPGFEVLGWICGM